MTPRHDGENSAGATTNPSRLLPNMRIQTSLKTYLKGLKKHLKMALFMPRWHTSGEKKPQNNRAGCLKSAEVSEKGTYHKWVESIVNKNIC